MGLLVCLDMLRQAGANISLLDCLDKDEADIDWPPAAAYGCGHYPKTEIPKPDLLRHVPRRFSRYGLPWEAVRQALQNLTPPPHLILITSVMTYWYPGVAGMVRMVREIWPGVPVCIGGIYATLCPEHAQKNQKADLVLPGCLENRENWEKLWGLMGQSAPKIKKDAGFTPALDLYPGPRFSPLLGSRGCPFNCSYCASSQLFKGFQQTDFDSFKKSFLAEYNRGVRDFSFYDDALLVNPERLLWPFTDMLREKSLQIRMHTPNAVHARYLDKNTCTRLKKAGLVTVRLGLESGFKNRHDFKLCREEWEAAVANLREAGFSLEEIGAYILFGLPGQKEEEIKQAIHLARQSGVRPQLALYTPIPGSKMFAAAQKHSPYPLEEPLFQNNSLWPCYPGGFTWEEHSRWKKIVQGREV